MLVPVDDGVLLIRRGVAPHIGKLALPGGYVELGETWREAGAREVLEETGVRIDPQQIREFRVHSVPEELLIFAVAAPLKMSELPPFEPTNETTERVVARQARDLAFALHGVVMREYFRERGV